MVLSPTSPRREPASAVADAIVAGIEDRVFEVIRGGETRAQMIALNRENPGAIDERFLDLKSALAEGVRDHIAVARASMPLFFYNKADYAVVVSAIALPLNLVNAMAAPILAALLTHTGPHGVLGTLVAMSSAGFFALLYLTRLRGKFAP